MAAATTGAVLRHVRRHIEVAHVSTKSAVSKPLSAPTVMRLLPGE